MSMKTTPVIRTISKMKEQFRVDWRPWPEDQPLRYNGCSDPCDAWTGPCICGAWHKEGT
jgi:hypothetical protein